MVKVNGEMLDVNGKTITELLDSMDINVFHVAVELNEEIITKTEYSSTVLNDGDTVEIVRFVGGGAY